MDADRREKLVDFKALSRNDRIMALYKALEEDGVPFAEIQSIRGYSLAPGIIVDDYIGGRFDLGNVRLVEDDNGEKFYISITSPNFGPHP